MQNFRVYGGDKVVDGLYQERWDRDRSPPDLPFITSETGRKGLTSSQSFFVWFSKSSLFLIKDITQQLSEKCSLSSDPVSVHDQASAWQVF